jgi:hypothetical protein
MEAVLGALEASALAQALKASFYVYPLVNAAHILAVGALVTTVLLMDLRLLGFLGSVDAGAFRRLMRRSALLAFASAVVTGMLLFSVRAADYAENPAFLAKLSLIVLACINLLVFTGLERGSGGTRVPRAPVVLSMTIWPLALIAGRFIGFL